jgi:mRNA interferase MazF
VGNEHGSTTIIATISKSIGDGFPFQVFVKAKDTGLDSDSVIDLQQIMTVDKNRLIKKLGKVKDETISDIDTALKISLNIK